MWVYYLRYLIEVWKDLRRFWKEQIAVSLTVGVINTVAGGGAGTIDRALVRKYILVSVASYAVLFAVRGCWALLKAPVNLDRERAAQLEQLDRRRLGEMTERDRQSAEERGRWARGFTDLNSELAECREALARKHPADAHKEQEIGRWVTELNKKSCEWLNGCSITGLQLLSK
jgi:hypothetical protein